MEKIWSNPFSSFSISSSSGYKVMDKPNSFSALANSWRSFSKLANSSLNLLSSSTPERRELLTLRTQLKNTFIQHSYEQLSSLRSTSGLQHCRKSDIIYPKMWPMEKRYPFGFIPNYWRPIYRLKHCLYINITAKFLYIEPVKYQMGK